MASLKRHRGKLVVDWEDDKGKRHRERVKDKVEGEKRLTEILKTNSARFQPVRLKSTQPGG